MKVRNNFGYIAALSLPVVLIVAGIFVFISCQKSIKDRTISRSYTKINILNHQLDVQNTSYYQVPSRVNSLARTSQQAALCLYTEVANHGIDDIINDLKSTLSGDVDNMPSDPYTLFLYSTEGGDIHDMSTVYAIGYLTIVNDKLEHHFISIASGSSTELSKYAATTDYITHSELDLLSESYTPGSTFGYAMMKNLDVSTGGLLMNQPNNGLAQAIINSGDDKLPVEDGSGCWSKPTWCAQRKDSYCQYDVAWYCTADGCRVTQVKQKGDDASITDPNNPLSIDKGHDVRDSIMMSYAIGRKYIDYFYALSYFGNAFKSSINASNLLSHVQLAYKMFDISDKLKNGNNSDVLIDNTTRNLALSLISEYRHYSTNHELQIMLDDISNDMDHFLNKTRAQVLAEIQ